MPRHPEPGCDLPSASAPRRLAQYPRPRLRCAASGMRRAASVALRNPANWNRSVPLTYEPFRYSFANAVGEDEAKELYLGYSVPSAGEPLFQAASANINPWSEAKVNTTNPERGPMLIVSADSDHTVPWAIAN